MYARRSAGSGSMSGAELIDAISGACADQVTVLRPLEVPSHCQLWRKAAWCADPLFNLGASVYLHHGPCSTAGLRLNGGEGELGSK